MLIAARNAIAGGKKISAKSYIQDGLIAMWDGIENAGWGVHDPNATVWRDLTGNGRDWTLISAGSFRDDCFYCNGNAAAAQQPILPLAYTIECLSQTISGRWIFVGNSKGNAGANPGCVQGFCNSADLTFVQTGFTYPTATTISYPRVNVREKHLLSVAYQYYNEYSLIPKDNYVDGSLVDSFTDFRNYWVNPGMSLLGYNNGGSASWLWTGSIYALRLYSRALTAEEIRHNYEIDRKRFGLP